MLLFFAHKAKNGLLLLQAHRENRPSCLKRIFKFFIEVKWSLNLNKCSELRTIVFDINSTMLITAYVGMKPRDGDVMNSHICIMATTKSNFFSVIKVYNMKLLLFFVVLLRRIYLKALNNHVIFGRLLDFKNLMDNSIVFKLIFKLSLTKLTMESFPSITGDMWCNLLVLVATEPLSKALQVDILHRTRALAWRNERILFGIFV